MNWEVTNKLIFFILLRYSSDTCLHIIAKKKKKTGTYSAWCVKLPAEVRTQNLRIMNPWINFYSWHPTVILRNNSPQREKQILAKLSRGGGGKRTEPTLKTNQYIHLIRSAVSLAHRCTSLVQPRTHMWEFRSYNARHFHASNPQPKWRGWFSIKRPLSSSAWVSEDGVPRDFPPPSPTSTCWCISSVVLATGYGQSHWIPMHRENM